jgi:shikimate kinase
MTDSHPAAQPDPAHRNQPARGPRSVFLIGFMGAGKSSVGAVLAELLGWRFIDLDRRIEERAKQRIADIFRGAGEDAFRRAESLELQQVIGELQAKGMAAVVALGGGAFVQPENAQMLAACGAHSVFLDAPVEELWLRAQATDGERPLAVSENHFRQLYAARRPRYMEADYCVPTQGRTVAEVAQDIAARLQLVTGKGEAE